MSSIFDKNPWRSNNIRFLEGRSGLWDTEGKLKYSYYEFVGLSGSEMYRLLEERLCTPKQFIGADHDAEAIQYHRMRDVPWTTALVQDGYSKAEEMAGYSATQRQPLGLAGHPVAIYGFDDYASVGTKSWWDTEASQLRQIVAKTLEQAGVCYLIINNTLDRIPDRVPAVEEHTKRFCDAFGSWGLTEEMLLGPKRRFLTRVAQGELGHFGGYEIYRSQDRKLRMATIRLEFTARGVRAWKGV